MTTLPTIPTKSKVSTLPCLSKECKDIGDYSRGYCKRCATNGNRYCAPSTTNQDERVFVTRYVLDHLASNDIPLSENARNVLISKAYRAYATGKPDDVDTKSKRQANGQVFHVATSVCKGDYESMVAVVAMETALIPIIKREVRDITTKGRDKDNPVVITKDHKVFIRKNVVTRNLRLYLAELGLPIYVERATNKRYVSCPHSFDRADLAKKMKEFS